MSADTAATSFSLNGGHEGGVAAFQGGSDVANVTNHPLRRLIRHVMDAERRNRDNPV